MSTAPCAGCPPCCSNCIFGEKAVPLSPSATILMKREEYGCIKSDAGALVVSDGTLGMIRGGSFHPVTDVGKEFLRKSGNILAAHC